MESATFCRAPDILPELDPAFRPAALAVQAFREVILKEKAGIKTGIYLEQADGSLSGHTEIFADPNSRLAPENGFFLERLVKLLLWSRGGFRVHVHGPQEFVELLRRHYQENPTGLFDAQIMGERIYERPFEVVHAAGPMTAMTKQKPLGRHLEGCRIGFDLGGSDRKVAAVINGKAIFSEETIWNPMTQSDPEWHFEQIQESLKRAAAHLPRVDAIGGSSAGVYVNNQVKVASLFRGVSPGRFEKEVKSIFLRLQQAWGGVPFEVANDGEVTALAGSMSLGVNSVLGLAFGTSMAGYVSPEGNITNWLNEVAFLPVDYNPAGPGDEWSGDFGCGVQYFSQQAVNRLLRPAGIDLPHGMSLAEKLKAVQDLMVCGDDRAASIFRTIGVYLGYSLAHFADFYDFESLLVLGRVTSGEGGNVIVREAKRVIESEFPALARKCSLHLPDEKDKRHGQAIAAASLPRLLK